MFIRCGEAKYKNIRTVRCYKGIKKIYIYIYIFYTNSLSSSIPFFSLSLTLTRFSVSSPLFFLHYLFFFFFFSLLLISSFPHTQIFFSFFALFCSGDGFCGQLWAWWWWWLVNLWPVVVVGWVVLGFLWPIVWVCCFFVAVVWVGFVGFLCREEVRRKLINRYTVFC